MSDLNTVQDRNEELARRIHEEAQRDPHSPYAHKCLGIVDSQVVVAADDWDEVFLRLQQIGADPQKSFCVRIDPSQHFNADNEIWELC